MLNVKMLKPLFYMFINIHTSLNLMVLPLTLMPLRRLKNWDIKSVFPSLMLLRRQKDWDVKSVSPSPHRWPTVPLSICHGHVRTDECLPTITSVPYLQDALILFHCRPPAHVEPLTLSLEWPSPIPCFSGSKRRSHTELQAKAGDFDHP